jgi:DNA-nicking Smr family endonuclease
LARLEERARRRLARGVADVDGRIDLHGMRQERAFMALTSFLRHAQSRGHRLVLVITGRGREDEEGRGVLRQMVPSWLARPEFRDLVLGFEEAGRRHGGSGALYVRIRRRRELRQSGV